MNVLSMRSSVNVYRKGTKVWTHYNKGTMGARVQLGPGYTSYNKDEASYKSTPN